MLYSQNVKNIIAGISQQPPILRLPEQLEEQINGLSTESSGLQKRPPTIHVKAMSSKINDDVKPLIHFVNRDANERYIMYFYNNSLTVFDLDGTAHTVNIQNDADYLQTSNPRNDLRIVTVADYTFIVNRNKITRMTATHSTSITSQGGLVHVKQGQYGRTYKIFIDGKCIAEHTTPDGSDKSHTAQIDTAYITNQLVAKCKASGWVVNSGDCWLQITGAFSSITTQDGFNNQAMIGFKDIVQRFNLLPSTAPDGYTVKVKGDPNGDNAGSYYVSYSKAEGVWKECVAPDIAIEIDSATMPHSLIREADGTFTFKQIEWTPRASGDNDSNPLPSFIDHTINDIFFFRNRLGLLSNENVILSESATYFNYWMTTANDILDTDCVDVPATTARVNTLLYAVPFNEELYCFSDSTQFVLRSDTTLSPKNTALIETTGFNSSPQCRPVAAGKNLYFPSERAEYSTIKEYYSVQNVSDVKNAQDITAHVASFIPNGVYQIICNTNENIMLFLTSGDTDSIYIYKYLFLNENRVQSSWSRWDMQGHVFGGFFIGSTLYLCINRGDKQMLEKINFTYNTVDFVDKEPYRVYLDQKKLTTTSTYDADYDITYFDVCSEYSVGAYGNDKVALVLPDGRYEEFSKDDIKDNKIHVNGNYLNKNVIIGTPYTFEATLSPIYIRQQDNQGSTKALTNGRLQLRDIRINYNKTGGFTADVLMSSGHTYHYAMTSRKIGLSSAVLGKVPNDSGEFRIPIQSLNTNCKVTIKSSMPLPVSLIGFLWTGNWVQRTKGG